MVSCRAHWAPRPHLDPGHRLASERDVEHRREDQEAEGLIGIFGGDRSLAAALPQLQTFRVCRPLHRPEEVIGVSVACRPDTAPTSRSPSTTDLNAASTSDRARTPKGSAPPGARLPRAVRRSPPPCPPAGGRPQRPAGRPRPGHRGLPRPRPCRTPRRPVTGVVDGHHHSDLASRVDSEAGGLQPQDRLGHVIPLSPGILRSGSRRGSWPTVLSVVIAAPRGFPGPCPIGAAAVARSGSRGCPRDVDLCPLCRPGRRGDRLRMIHEVDSALRALIEREASGTRDVEVVFDAPTKDWASRRNAPDRSTSTSTTSARTCAAASAGC